MGSRAAAEALEVFRASVAALAEIVPGGRGSASAGEGAGECDLLRQEADDWLDTLAESARLQAATAALVVHAAAGFTRATQAMAPPPASPQEHTAQEMAVVAEVACVLTVSEGDASALLADSHALTSTLPLTLAALQDGSISWQHARVVVDETTGIDAARAAALEAHFLAPDC
ncbi:hypothetical protein QFZ40_003754 [Arthrobacter pascens]|nr:hypothetical protein [Arthrobacter pascens]